MREIVVDVTIGTGFREPSCETIKDDGTVTLSLSLHKLLAPRKTPWSTGALYLLLGASHLTSQRPACMGITPETLTHSLVHMHGSRERQCSVIHDLSEDLHPPLFMNRPTEQQSIERKLSRDKDNCCRQQNVSLKRSYARQIVLR